jgi:hypothetical protein
MAHIAFAFILSAFLALRWPVFGGRNTVLVMIGAVLADIFKLYLALQLLGIYAQDSLELFHIPIGTVLVCGLGALLFEGGTRVRVFLLFALGMVTHYALDGLLIHESGGLKLLYPLSWGRGSSSWCALTIGWARPLSGDRDPRVACVEGLEPSPRRARDEEDG